MRKSLFGALCAGVVFSAIGIAGSANAAVTGPYTPLKPLVSDTADGTIQQAAWHRRCWRHCWRDRWGRLHCNTRCARRWW